MKKGLARIKNRRSGAFRTRGVHAPHGCPMNSFSDYGKGKGGNALENVCISPAFWYNIP